MKPQRDNLQKQYSAEESNRKKKNILRGPLLEPRHDFSP